jgi:hypothetical protein
MHQFDPLLQRNRTNISGAFLRVAGQTLSRRPSMIIDSTISIHGESEFHRNLTVRNHFIRAAVADALDISILRELSPFTECRSRGFHHAFP